MLHWIHAICLNTSIDLILWISFNLNEMLKAFVGLFRPAFVVCMAYIKQHPDAPLEPSFLQFPFPRSTRSTAASHVSCMLASTIGVTEQMGSPSASTNAGEVPAICAEDHF